MASKKGGGEVVNLTVTILRSIRDELRELNARVGTLESTTALGFAATARGFEAVTMRLENLRDFSGERWRDHERRIRRLESRASSK